ncbi:MAG: putative two-component system response regulator [Herminiimonas sp.]|nr:putative two-component system response regulator [Herminiimonas sp.]
MKQFDEAIRVMLADDHRTMLWGLTALIQGQRPRMDVVCAARSCTEALDGIAEFEPDVLLLDLDMNGESGLDILPALLSNRSTRVVILTGDRDQATLDLAVQRGARGILHKDASAEHVLKAIEKVHRGELWLDQETLGRVFGALMSPATCIARDDPELKKQATLTAREKKIIRTVLAESGAPNKTIANKLFISEHTLRNHLTSIYQKLGVANRLGLYVYANKHRLGEPAGETIRISTVIPKRSQPLYRAGQ